MTTLRRILTAATLVVAAAGFASADIITSLSFNGCSAVSGGVECSVTQSGSLGFPTPVNMNIVSPNSLFDFQFFGSLGITGVLNGASMDYQYDNYATNLSITNNDSTSSATVNVALQSTALLDSGTNLPGCVAGVASGNNDCLHARNDMQGVSNAGAAGVANNIFSQSNLTLAPGETKTFAPPPVTFTNGISYFGGGCAPGSCFGNPADALALNPNNYTGTGIFSFGLTDAASFSQGAAGNGGSANITVVYTTTYDAQAEVTYNYFVSNGTPEPSTMLLMGSALIGLSFLGRRLAKR